MINPVDDIVVIAPHAGTSPVELLNPLSYLRGRVLAVGPGLYIRGKLYPPDVKVNDMVFLAQGKAIEAVFDNKRVWITREKELLAVETGERC